MGFQKSIFFHVAVAVVIFLILCPDRPEGDGKMKQAFANLCNYLGERDNYTAMFECMKPVMNDEEIMSAVMETFVPSCETEVPKYEDEKPLHAFLMDLCGACAPEMGGNPDTSIPTAVESNTMTETMFPDEITKKVMKKMGEIMACFKDYGIGMKEMMG